MNDDRRILISAAVLLTATVALVAALLGWDGNPVRAAAGLFLAWFAPGYALLFALSPNGRDTSERLPLSVPLSFVLAILTGLVLDITRVGLRAPAYVGMLWLLTAALLALGHYRLRRGARVETRADGFDEQTAPMDGDRGAPPSRATAPAAALGTPRPRGAARDGRPWAILGIGGVLLAASIAWAASSLVAASDSPRKPFTVLALEEDYTQVVVENREGRPMRYTLSARVGSSVVQRVEDIQLRDGERRTVQLRRVEFRPEAPGTEEVLLFRQGDTRPYRQLRLQLWDDDRAPTGR